MRRIRGRWTWKNRVLLFFLLAAGICFFSRACFPDSHDWSKRAGGQQESRSKSGQQESGNGSGQQETETEIDAEEVSDYNSAEKEYFGKYSAAAAAFIWKQYYPVYWDSTETLLPESPEKDNKTGWLVDFVMRQVPYYRAAKEQEKISGQREIDPAYKSYMESRKILTEYEYLMRNLSDSAVMASGNNPLNPGASLSAGGSGAGTGTETGTGIGGTAGPGTEENMAGTEILQKNGIAVTGTRYIEEQLADYDFLMKHFYTVHPTTTAGRDMMSAETFLSENLSLTETNENPQILIYHTHSQEEFADYSPGNPDATIVGVGNYLTELLEAKGYNVIHDTSVYDLKDGKLDRSKAYTYALDGITGILQKYPSIQVVLDVHRDGVKAGTHLVQQVNGKQTATIMFFNGTSQTPTGPIEYLQNPYRTDNMAFSFQMKLCADACYPGFTRKIYLKGLRYNMHLRARSALIEVGAQTNTYDEAKNAMEPLSELLDMVLRPGT